MSFDRQKFMKAIRGTLIAADWYSHGGTTAVLLLVGTAAAESDFGTYNRQLGNGPARGVFQMEPATLLDIYRNFFPGRPELFETLAFLTGIERPDVQALENNLTYQILICRVHYFRVPEPLPEPKPWPLGMYWKQHYNTWKGAGTVQKFVTKWKQYVED